MKPLSKNSLENFLKRFEYFKDGEFRDIIINSPTNITLNFAIQDASRGYDWITLKLEFDGISDASLLDSSNLAHIDMSEGVYLKNDGTEFAFKVNNSTFKIKSSSLKYEEGQF
ncbi:hypothetical protein FJR48_00045 [Sulfurimonas lithotrophica]|uniref:Uncharacterized protein n=1 Tax=Sulfurimonas lithotrophica TaxID=2590022 RepID=A0A5P8NXP9_9BACT|nr:hypothetical protein [Sulfurimonas lithotrophica]QFR48198.1 hypothetical protein FJR48_00045 [Sulfurimonas lithotrophica]